MDLSELLRKNIQSAETKHDKAIACGALCKQCPLYKKPRGPVLGDIKPNSKLVVIGETLGGPEMEQRKLLTGRPGIEVDEGLIEGGLTRKDVSVTKVIACQPDIEGGGLGDYLQWLKRENEQRPANDQLMSPIEACRPRLINELRKANSDVWLAIGSTALESAAQMHGLRYGKGKDQVGDVTIATIMNQHGSPIRIPKDKIDASPVPGELRVICSSLHPNFAMRGKRAYKPVIRKDIARAARIAVRGYIDWEMPKQTFVFPDPATIEHVCAQMVAEGAKVAVDIESDSVDTRSCRVRCVGLGATVGGEETILVVPFRWMDGREYWPSRDLKIRVIAAVRSVLDGCDLIAHNGAFDTAVLLRCGLMTDRNKLWDDTMIGHHDTDHNDLPHTLGFVATRFLEVPMWKKDVDHKATDNVAKDHDLHQYNAVDIATTMRVWTAIEERILACGTTPQYETDKALAPIAREMERLGLFVDEHERGKLSRKLNKVCYKLRQRFVENAKVNINPRSPHQLAQWLFHDLGLQPPLNPQGYEWQEGDGYSTSAQALTKILDKDGQYLDAETKTAIESLLEFKSAEKLRSTYVDGLDVRYDDVWRNEPMAPEVRETIYNKKGVPEETLILPKRYAYSQIHPVWKIHVVPTGRWSSSPNAQNWPARAWGKLNLRELIVAPPGHVIVGADFEQVELRIYAVQAQDRLLLQAFKTPGMDPHAMNAAVLFSPKQDDKSLLEFHDYILKLKKSGDETKVSKAKHFRNVAKRFVYLETYGGEEDKLFSVMSTARDKATGKLDFPNIKPSDCEIWHERWHKMHPETKIWQQRCAMMQKELGYVAALHDYRRRYFPGGPDKKNSVANHTIQGSAAAIMNRGVRRIAEAIPFGCWSEYTGLCLQVHDYAGVYVPEEKAEETQHIIEECLNFAHEGLSFPVDKPLATRNWADQG